ncbi:MAG: hypothetical protein A2Y10_14540 [Planctomycetes bacterium GWF2_41_51]|nr:MAG: hypothetical protein A2Y10_14540 [Planctomycetes bacterium GWF2_41_51]HBG25503.1 hypothetical protein [Phycisphaerales bacterium]
MKTKSDSMNKKTIKVLLVEDDDGDIILTRSLLCNSHTFEFVVESAKKLSDAITHLNDQAFDLALLDMGLPDSSGIDTVQRIRQTNQHLPIVVLTGFNDEETGRLAIQNGASDYLIKDNLSGDTLIRTIIFSIERKQAEKEREKMLFFQLGINSIQQSLLRTIPIEERLQRVTDDIVKFFNVDFCRIWLIQNGDACQNGCDHAQIKDGPNACNNRDKCLHLVSSSGRYTNTEGAFYRRVPFGCYMIGMLASDVKYKHVTNDIQNDIYIRDRQWAKENGLISYAAYQLRFTDGQPMGVMALFSKNPIESCEDAMLDGISSNAALAVYQSQTSKQLQESEEKYQSLINNSVMGVAVMDTNHRIIQVNSVLSEMFKKPASEFVGKFCYKEFEKRDAICEHCPGARALISGKTEDVETQGIRDDGSRFYVRNRAVPFFGHDGAVKGFIEIVEDIDVRKRAEEELRWKTALLESQVEANLDGVLVVDNQGKRILINKRLINMWKVPNEIVENKDETVLMKYAIGLTNNPQDVLEKVKYLNSHPDEISRDEIEYKDGTVLDRYSSAIIDKEGKNLGRIWTFRDITDRKLAETALRKNASVINSIFHAAPIGIVLTKKRFIYKMNGMFSEISGYAENDLIGKTALVLYQNIGEYNRVGYELYNNLLQTGLNSSETKWRRKDGALIDVLLNVSPLDVNDIDAGEIITVLDITELKLSQEAILRERNKAQSYLDVAGVIMLVLNRDMTVHRINNKGCEILGYDENEIIGKNWCDTFIPPQYKNDIREMFSYMMKGEIKNCEYHENPILTKKGKQRLIAWHNVIMYDEGRNIISLLSSGEDITERKEAEEAIKKAYKELEKANSDMKNMQAQIIQSEKLASIGQLAAGVAHEMNTPVGFVACNFETLEKYLAKFKKLIEMYNRLADDIPNNNSAALLEKNSTIIQAAIDMKMDFVLDDIDALFEESKEGLTRVTTIIQNLRDFSRIDQVESLDSFNINQGLESTLAVARNTIKYHADVITEFGDIPQVLCNASQLNQVFLNILVNAAHAIESQHRDSKGSIRVKTYSDDAQVICEIEDDGPGIKPENIKKIYDPFFTTKLAGKGTGLGLSVSYDIIVNKHKGMLLVDSVYGNGAKFTIKIPLKPVKENNENSNELIIEAQKAEIK